MIVPQGKKSFQNDKEEFPQKKMFNTWIPRKLLASIRILKIVVLFFWYRIRAYPMLGIGYIAVRRILFICSAYLRKLDFTWNRIQDDYNQDQNKG